MGRLWYLLRYLETLLFSLLAVYSSLAFFRSSTLTEGSYRFASNEKAEAVH